MKEFFKSFLGSYLGSCFGIATICILPALVFTLAITGMISESINQKTAGTAEVSNNAFLVIDISNGFSDHPTYSAYNQGGILFESGNGAYGLLETIQAISAAKSDSRICGILLTGANCTSGYATIQEIKKALDFFKKSNKPVISYIATPTVKDYFLSTVADKIWIHPFAEIQMSGLSSTGIYFKDALEKAGIGIQITKVGKFKSAVEPLISNTMSEADRAQRIQLLTSNWETIKNTVAKARGVPVSIFTDGEKPAKGLYNAEEAKAAKLIDDAKYMDEVISELSEIGEFDSENKSFKQVDLRTYMEEKGIAQAPKLGEESTLNYESEKIAVVYAEGEIVDGDGNVNEIGGDRLSSMIREIRNDHTVKGVVFRVNSPGGSVFASEQIRRELEILSKEKRLVVSMGDVAASGGYWISTPAEKIFSNEMTITGSIGVFGILINLEDLGKKLGISTEAVKTNALAEITTVRRPKTPEELAVIQKSVDEIYERFTNLVCESRKIEKNKMPELAEGRVWDGKSAKNFKLTDEFGGIAQAINYLKKELGDNNLEIQQYPQPTNRFQELIDMLQDSQSPAPFAMAKMRSNSAAGTLNNAFIEAWGKIRALNDPQNIYARMPWDFEDAE